MEFLRGLTRFINTRRKPPPIDDAEADRIIAAMNRSIEAFAAEMIASLYVYGEQRILDTTGQTEDVMRRLSSPRFVTARRKFNLTGEFVRGITGIGKDAIEQILPTIPDPSVRRSIQVNGINQAIGFWKEQLESPDLRPDQRIMGNRRLTQLDAQLDSLTERNQHQ